MGAPAPGAGASDAAPLADERAAVPRRRRRANTDEFAGLKGPRAQAQLAAQGLCVTCFTHGASHRPHTYTDGCLRRRVVTVSADSGPRAVAPLAPQASDFVRPTPVDAAVQAEDCYLKEIRADLSILHRAVAQLQETTTKLQQDSERHHESVDISLVSLEERMDVINERLTEVELLVRPRGPDGEFLECSEGHQEEAVPPAGRAPPALPRLEHQNPETDERVLHEARLPPRATSLVESPHPVSTPADSPISFGGPGASAGGFPGGAVGPLRGTPPGLDTHPDVGMYQALVPAEFRTQFRSGGSNPASTIQAPTVTEQVSGLTAGFGHHIDGGFAGHPHGQGGAVATASSMHGPCGQNHPLGSGAPGTAVGGSTVRRDSGAPGTTVGGALAQRDCDGVVGSSQQEVNLLIKLFTNIRLPTFADTSTGTSSMKLRVWRNETRGMLATSQPVVTEWWDSMWAYLEKEN